MAGKLKRGTTGVSYGLVVGLIAVVALVATTNIGGSVDGLFTEVGGTLDNVTTGANNALPQPSASASASAETPLFAFTSQTFTDCGASGMNGPTLGMCSGSIGQSWSSNTSFFDMPLQGYQLFTIPSTGTYTIEVAGAGNNGETYYGARLSGDVTLTQGDKLLILVGQRGNQYVNGSGGTFVALGDDPSSATPLIIGGGAGGHYTTAPNPERRNATFTEDAYYSLDSTTPSNWSGPTGSGGNGGGGYHGGGGGGFFTSGTDNHSSDNTFGNGFRQGGVGGTYSSNAYQGGFGGGGAYHAGANGGGGGGGYSGGRGGYSSTYHGWGGGSYTASSISNRQDLGIDNGGDGFVTITLQ